MAWQRTDDLDGTPATQRTFGLDGKAYMIDLADPNAAKLRKALQPFLTVAQEFGVMPEPDAFATPAPPVIQPVGEPQVAPPPPPAADAPARRRGKQSTAVSTGTVREWARSNGFQVSDKGRIPDAVLAEYHAAH